MQRPNPVQSIARQPQQFRRADLPPVQSALSMGQPQQQQTAEQAIQEQMAELSLEIYCRLAVAAHISDDSYERASDPARLQRLARDAQAAARAYFQSMGVQFSE